MKHLVLCVQKSKSEKAPNADKASYIIRMWLNTFYDLIVSKEEPANTLIEELVIDIADNKVLLVVNNHVQVSIEARIDGLYYSIRGMQGVFKADDSATITTYTELVETVKDMKEGISSHVVNNGEEQIDLNEVLERLGSNPFIAMLLKAMSNEHRN